MRALPITLLLCLLTSACSDSSNSSSPDLKTGRLTTSGVSGLTYRTATEEGQLNDAGEFTYRDGETISFWVGDLLLVEGVPAKDILTPLEFEGNARADLQIGGIENGLTTHKIPEVEITENNTTIRNLTRFLLVMNENLNDTGEQVVLTERNIEQFNVALQTVSDPIDFTVSEDAFALNTETETSPINQVIEQICFFSEESRLCEEPPTPEEIANTESKFNEDGSEREDLDEDFEYREDLQSLRDAIIESRRHLDDVNTDSIGNYLADQAENALNDIGSQFFLLDYAAELNEGDNETRIVELNSVELGFELDGFEVVSLNEEIVRIADINMAERQFSYFSLGTSGQETTILINFKRTGDYRWFRQNFRVIID
ncbi:MAG: hypothetical protein MI864_27380 [Pseudomonadales bacterium]|uniref:DrugE1 family ABC transporter periplasmic protein n=1 Tax=Oleiphilus messinensis TaxID=141451 RepID=A0A1Y0I9C1_9GAMM|nr:hypothetical protein [Oleiphilus messinensis]ARU57112.1 DrugE1 family ABC transporter periplasmic protein [Oleiphilus messinensis]MCG8614251.1 hypothetical protein [Pseudomonadales bacterium]